MLTQLRKELHTLADPQHQIISCRFLKTGIGEYGEGDQVLGIKIPMLRELVKRYPNLTLAEQTQLLTSPIHEYRTLALLFLIQRYRAADSQDQTLIITHYLNHLDFVNNWDLVDLSAPTLLGDYLRDRERTILYQLIQSPSLWTKRVALVATLPLIKNQDFQDSLHLMEHLLTIEQPPLIHKAMGWMLREISQRHPHLTQDFLKLHPNLPRITVRYAIEKFPPKERALYLKIRPKKIDFNQF